MATSEALATSRALLLSAAVLAGCAGTSGATRTAESSAVVLRAPVGAESTTLAALTSSRQATVLVFWSSGCPCVRRYQARVEAFAERYASRDVQVLAVSSNAGEPFEEALSVARERGVRVPLLRDDGGEVAKLVGARSTPTVALLDRSGAVRFVGWLDNEREPGVEGREAWLEQAVEGVLGGGSFAKRTPTWGCPITRSLSSVEPRRCEAAH
ncbi:MAG: redoxin family protein [Myxococcaceae bacterium]|nr:redoxin family protein [Myxococcaceae bacterium]